MRYLLQKTTDRIYIYTDPLAARPDMVECTKAGKIKHEVETVELPQPKELSELSEEQVFQTKRVKAMSKDALIEEAALYGMGDVDNMKKPDLLKKIVRSIHAGAEREEQ